MNGRHVSISEIDVNATDSFISGERHSDESLLGGTIHPWNAQAGAIHGELLGAGSGGCNDADGNSLLELMRVSVPGNLGEQCHLKLVLAWSRSDPSSR